MSIRSRCLLPFVVGLALLPGVLDAQAAACIKLRNIADFEQIRTNLNGKFCLVNDIDASSVANFVPIENAPSFFGGTLDGRGFVIRNLTISSGAENVGLIGRIDNGGKVKDLGLVDVNVTGTSANVQNVGALAAVLSNGSIAKSFASGTVTGTGHGSSVGGLVGLLVGPLTDSYATGPVTGGSSGHVGGLVGRTGNVSGNIGNILRCYATGTATGEDFASVGGLVGTMASTTLAESYATGTAEGGNTANVGGLAGTVSGVTISKSYATGEARTGTNSAKAGGLAGHAGGSTIVRSFATGFVRGGQGDGSADVGGLVGHFNETSIFQTYATGTAHGGTHSRVGGLVGSYFSSPDTIQQSYSAGSVEVGGENAVGGLTGGPQDSAFSSYWDVQTSGRTTSFGGLGKTTKQLKAKVPFGFNKNVWSITPGVSYPFLTDPDLNFSGALAIVVHKRTPQTMNRIYTFLPISQLDPDQYAVPAVYADQASLATVYTMIARPIGITDYVSELNGVKIDTYFWDDATQTATWNGPVEQYATLGPLTTLAAAQPIDDGNIIGPLKSEQVVIIRGTYDLPGGGSGTHWMLATSFTVTGGGVLETLVANDPWTGLQVRIDPATKLVIAPADFPLANFKVKGFRVVSLD